MISEEPAILPANFLQITKEEFPLLELEKAYQAIVARITSLEEKKKNATKKVAGVCILRGPAGSGKTLVLTEALKQVVKAIVINVSVRRGNVVFEPTDELIQKLTQAITEHKGKFRKFFKAAKEDALDALDFFELLDLIPLYGTAISRALRLGVKGISILGKRLKKKKGEPTIITTEREHDKKLQEIFEKLVVLSRARPVIIILDNLQWLQKDDQQVFAKLHKLLAGKAPVLVIGCLTDIKLTNAASRQKTRDANVETLIKDWTTAQNIIQINDLSKEALNKWLVKRFANEELAEEFLEGLYKLTAGNIKYVIKTLEYLTMEGLIETKNYENCQEWVLPENWNLVLPENIMNLEVERLNRLLEKKKEELDYDYHSWRRVLEKAAVVGAPFRAFEVDVLEGILPQEEENCLPEILDFGVEADLFMPFEYRMEFTSDTMHTSLYKHLGRAVKSELHYQTAKTLEKLLKEKSHDEKEEALYYHQLALHYEGATQTYSKTRAMESREKVHRYYVLAALSKFTAGATEEALSLTGCALKNLYFNPVERYELTLEQLKELVALPKESGKKAKVEQFITEELIPSYYTLLSFFLLPEIIEKTKERMTLSYLEPMYALLLKTVIEGQLKKSEEQLKKLFKQIEDITTILEKLAALFTPITYLLQHLFGSEKAREKELRLTRAYEEFLAINELLISGFEKMKSILDGAYLYNLLAHYSEKMGKDPKKYYLKAGETYLKASKLPIKDVVLKARITRNAGWNYKNANLKKAIAAFKTAKNILEETKLEYDYIRYRIAEYDLRIVQLIAENYAKQPDALPKELAQELKEAFERFWEKYGEKREYSSYPAYLLEQLKPLQKALGKQFVNKLQSIAKPIPQVRRGEQEGTMTIIATEWDYWLADVVHEHLRKKEPKLEIKIVPPEKYAEALEKEKTKAIILFGGPKAPYIGDVVSRIFKGTENFRLLTWRHEAGFGGVWAKKHKKILHILIAGNDEETIDGTLLFLTLKNPWTAGYHLSILENYFKH